MGTPETSIYRIDNTHRTKKDNNTGISATNKNIIQQVADTDFTGTLELSWNAASDDSSPITYNVYMATSSGGQNFNTPDYTTQQTTFKASGLTNGNTYYFVVRAEDVMGNKETNTVEESGIPTGSISKQKWAVIVGISDYKAISDLSYCDEDATDWYDYLTDSSNFADGIEYTNIWVFGDGHTSNYPQHDGYATEYNVKNQLQYVADNAGPDDTIAFITSGHGDGDGNWNSYLCMWDCGSGEDGEDGDFEDNEVAAILETAIASDIFVFIDHCYSGGMGDDLMAISNSENIYCTTTCTEDGYGYDDPSHSNGAWTYEFLEKYLFGDPLVTMEYNFDRASASYPHTGGDAAMEFDGDSSSTFYL